MASPLLGYNNNFRHKNRVFHVQTEDSGVKHPHIITHLFADGGRIVKSVKTSYAEYVGNPKMVDIVREMLKQQHKAMIIALRDGQFDHELDLPAKIATAPATPAAQPSAAGADATAPAAGVAEASGAATRAPTPGSNSAVRAGGGAAAAPPATDPIAPTTTARGDDADEDSAPDTAPPDTTRSPGEHELTLDIEALERAAAATDVDPSAMALASELPPPPENLFRERSATGAYRSVAPPGTSDTDRPPGRRPRSNVPPGPRGNEKPSRATPDLPRDGEGRYGPARPAAIFGGKPKVAAPAKSMFGEDLVSDKSLDEVILSYLAEDLDAGEKR